MEEITKLAANEDTICAIATALGVGAIGIIRLSGPEALAISQEIFQAASGKKIQAYPSHTMIYGKIVDEKKDPIDEVLLVYMQGPRSYTAEDVVEIQCHGGVESLKTILAQLYKKGARPAEPGEFTKRAFLNGRIDLTQAEAVMDIITSRSQAGLKNALRQEGGALSRELAKIRKSLLDEVVHLEAVIDYPEEDIEDVTYPEVKEQLEKTREQVNILVQQAQTGRILQEGLRTAIVGRPNVGKSSLLNMLLDEERAIVSDRAGTTRDVIEEQFMINGIPLLLIDTAGIHATEDSIEKIGIAKSKASLEKSELAIVVVDGSEALQPADREILNLVLSRPYVIIVNKTDLPACGVTAELKQLCDPDRVLELSAKTRSGLPEFQAWLERFVYGKQGNLREGLFVQNARQEELLRQAKVSLDEACIGCEERRPYDCLVIDIKDALALMGQITGETRSDEIISEIFARFCVGK